MITSFSTTSKFESLNLNLRAESTNVLSVKTIAVAVLLVPKLAPSIVNTYAKLS